MLCSHSRDSVPLIIGVCNDATDLDFDLLIKIENTVFKSENLTKRRLRKTHINFFHVGRLSIIIEQSYCVIVSLWARMHRHTASTVDQKSRETIFKIYKYFQTYFMASDS